MSLRPKSKQLWNLLTSKPFDLILVNTRYYPLTLLGLHLAKATRTNAALIDHSSNYLTINKKFLSKAIRVYENIMTKKVLSYQPDCYGVSTKTCSWLTSLGFIPKGVIPNSIDSKHFRAIASERDYLNEFDIKPTDTIITFAGRLVPEKGAHKVIAACQSIQANHNIHLFVAGSGEQLNCLINKASPFIHILGPLSQNDLSSLLSQTDIFCFPTEYPEGLPSVVLEAGAHSCTVVMSDTGGSKDLLPTNKYGITLESTNVSDIVDALNFLINNPKEADNMGCMLKAHIEKNFSWKATAEKVVGLC